MRCGPTAAAGKPHKRGVDQPESVVAIAEYPEDFVGVFTVNYAAMQYRTRNDQLNQLDGDQGRMDIGREELKVFLKGAEDQAAMSPCARAMLTATSRSLPACSTASNTSAW